MASDQEARSGRPEAVTEPVTEPVTELNRASPTPRSLALRAGRSLTIDSGHGIEDLIEIHDATGQVELRIRLTNDGPVLQLDGVRLSMNAADAIEMRCKTLSVDASESVQLASRGTLRVRSEDELNIESPDDVHVRGDNLYLNCDPDFTPGA